MKYRQIKVNKINQAITNHIVGIKNNINIYKVILKKYPSLLFV